MGNTIRRGVGLLFPPLTLLEKLACLGRVTSLVGIPEELRKFSFYALMDISHDAVVERIVRGTGEGHWYWSIGARGPNPNWRKMLSLSVEEQADEASPVHTYAPFLFPGTLDVAISSFSSDQFFEQLLDDLGSIPISFVPVVASCVIASRILKKDQERWECFYSEFIGILTHAHL